MTVALVGVAVVAACAVCVDLHAPFYHRLREPGPLKLPTKLLLENGVGATRYGG